MSIEQNTDQQTQAITPSEPFRDLPDNAKLRAFEKSYEFRRGSTSFAGSWFQSGKAHFQKLHQYAEEKNHTIRFNRDADCLEFSPYAGPPLSVSKVTAVFKEYLSTPRRTPEESNSAQLEKQKIRGGRILKEIGCSDRDDIKRTIVALADLPIKYLSDEQKRTASDLLLGDEKLLGFFSALTTEFDSVASPTAVRIQIPGSQSFGILEAHSRSDMQMLSRALRNFQQLLPNHLFEREEFKLVDFQREYWRQAVSVVQQDQHTLDAFFHPALEHLNTLFGIKTLPGNTRFGVKDPTFLVFKLPLTETQCPFIERPDFCVVRFHPPRKDGEDPSMRIVLYHSDTQQHYFAPGSADEFASIGGAYIDNDETSLEASTAFLVEGSGLFFNDQFLRYIGTENVKKLSRMSHLACIRPIPFELQIRGDLASVDFHGERFMPASFQMESLEELVVVPVPIDLPVTETPVPIEVSQGETHTQQAPSRLASFVRRFLDPRQWFRR